MSFIKRQVRNPLKISLKKPGGMPASEAIEGARAALDAEAAHYKVLQSRLAGLLSNNIRTAAASGQEIDLRAVSTTASSLAALSGAVRDPFAAAVARQIVEIADSQSADGQNNASALLVHIDSLNKLVETGTSMHTEDKMALVTRLGRMQFKLQQGQGASPADRAARTAG